MKVKILNVKKTHNKRLSSTLIPVFRDKVSAGFPSPAEDYIERELDLNELCIKNPSSSYFVEVDGDSMIDAGIYPNDILVVDRSITVQHGNIIIACLNNELTVKEIHLKPTPILVPHNSSYSPITITDSHEFEVFGVVTNIIRKLK